MVIWCYIISGNIVVCKIECHLSVKSLSSSKYILRVDIKYINIRYTCICHVLIYSSCCVDDVGLVPIFSHRRHKIFVCD